jgi:hypothetical protein
MHRRPHPFFLTCSKHLRTWCVLWQAMHEREAELDAIDAALADLACTDEQRAVHLCRLGAIADDETLHRRAARLQARMLRHLQSQLDRLAREVPR